MEFKIIPEFPDYEINKDGIVRNITTKIIKKTNKKRGL